MTRKILIVDDDQTQREIYVEAFKTEGYEVFQADDGLEGLNMAKEHKPDILFTGIMMPQMDGFELMQMLRTNVETARIPVCFFSHLGREEDRLKGEKLGANHFFIKGVDSPREIVNKINELFTQKNYKVKLDKTVPDVQRLIDDYHLVEPIFNITASHDDGRLTFKIELD